LCSSDPARSEPGPGTAGEGRAASRAGAGGRDVVPVPAQGRGHPVLLRPPGAPADRRFFPRAGGNHLLRPGRDGVEAVAPVPAGSGTSSGTRGAGGALRVSENALTVWRTPLQPAPVTGDEAGKV